MKISQRQSILGVMILLTTVNLLLVVALQVPSFTQDLDQSLAFWALGSLITLCGLLIAYWRGWNLARYIVVIYMVAVVAIATPPDFVTDTASITIFIPPALALILAEPLWVVGSAGALYALLLMRAGGEGAYANPITLLLTVIIVGSMVVARLVTDTALASAREHARRAEDEKKRAEAQAFELAEANDLMNRQLDQQKQLLDLVATLETPAVPLADGVLFAPLVGHVDTRRAQNLTTRLLNDVAEQHARLIVLDIAGVSMIDTAVAKALLNTAQALRLLGCEVAISGISAAVAMTLISLGISMEGVSTARSPQEALAQYLQSSAIKAGRNGKRVQH
jgi:rsbT co-antagonist protein RsbR